MTGRKDRARCLATGTTIMEGYPIAHQCERDEHPGTWHRCACGANWETPAGACSVCGDGPESSQRVYCRLHA